ncbi:NUDIX domain-containing protein [Schaalia sp. ZJ1691]|uniref:NUDIX hydrolase n=1 Tax=Schaalia sp. ZJ1691 TaxID=2709404 RepID=UPI0013EDBC37|nr:NUDIX domain-containing protein [Schaalia sp. ZJ1691]
MSSTSTQRHGSAEERQDHGFSALGPEWPLDADGVPHREAARIVLFNECGQLLLAQGHDRDNPSRQWWFTIGGGLMPNENPRDGAVRELYEETGIRISPEQLIGPVLYRQAEFDFLSVTGRQDEWFFVAHTHTQELTDAGWTDLERDVIDTQRWWTLDDLEAEARMREVYPRRLAEHARSWLFGWDGSLVTLTEHGS